MDMRVNPAGEDVHTGCVNYPVTVVPFCASPRCRYHSPVDKQICYSYAGGCHNGTVDDEYLHLEVCFIDPYTFLMVAILSSFCATARLVNIITPLLHPEAPRCSTWLNSSGVTV